MADQVLEVVNEADQVVGTELRSVIHTQGLLHREVHIFFVTPDKHVILQRRASHKDWGDYLDATVGGHVEPGQTYLEAALMEIAEETGLSIAATDLMPLTTLRSSQTGSSRGIINNVFRAIFYYPFNGKLADLQVEASDGAGFVAKPLTDLQNLSAAHAGEIVPSIVSEDYQQLYRRMYEM